MEDASCPWRGNNIWGTCEKSVTSIDDNKYLVPRQPRDSCSVYVFSRLMISRLSPADFQKEKSGTTFEEKIRDATAVLKQIHYVACLASYISSPGSWCRERGKKTMSIKSTDELGKVNSRNDIKVIIREVASHKVLDEAE